MPSRPGLGLSAVPSPSHFSRLGIREHRARETPAIGGELRGRHRSTAGRQDRAARQPAPGARGQRGQPGERAGELDRGPRDPATRVGPGAEHPGRLRPSRQGWHGRARGWELHNLAAAPAGPASSRGEPERDAAAGCPRDPCPRSSPAGLPRPPPPSTGRAPRPCPGGAASAPRAPHGARAAIATHRGRLGSGPPIRVAPSFPGEPCPAAARGHGRCARAGWGRLVLRLRRGRRRLPSSGLCCNVCEADFERLARRPPAAAALLPPPPTSRRPGPSPRCSTPFSSSAKFLNPFLPLPPIVTRAERAPGGSPGAGEPTRRLQASSLVLRVGVRG